MPGEPESNDFLTAFRGTFAGILQWEQLTTLWTTMKSAPEGWYIYAVGSDAPSIPRSADDLCAFLDELDVLLRSEHRERYCGIVYVDSVNEPSFVKVFDPSNLGTSCGCSDTPRLPGWVLSRLQPVNLETALPQPTIRRRWWQRVFA